MNESMHVSSQDTVDDAQKKQDIKEIEHFEFRGAWQRIGADCSGDSRGECARSNYAKCGVYHNCEAASQAMGPQQICPSFALPESARAEAEHIYEKVKGMVKYKSIDDKGFEMSYALISPEGEKVKPKYELSKIDDRSTEYLEWYDPSDVESSLVLTTNFSKDGRAENDDISSFRLPGSPTPKQLETLRKFCEAHGIEFPQ